jgi:hypothetical protein
MAIKGVRSGPAVAERHLQSFIAGGVLPKKSTGKWRLPAGEAQPRPGPGEFVVFLSFLEWGLAFPTFRIFRRLLAF